MQNIVYFNCSRRPQIKRLIQLSSAAAITGAEDVGEIEERHWNEGALTEVKTNGRTASPVSKYQASTYLAEKDVTFHTIHMLKSERT